MCAPLAYVAATTAAGLYNEHVKAQYGEKVFEENKQNAEDNAIRSYQALTGRQAEENAKATQAVAKNAREVTLANGAAATGAAEAGIAGNSVGALLGDFQRTSLDYERTVIRNKAFLDAQFNRESYAIQQRERMEILGALPQPPNYMGVLIGGAASALEVQAKTDAQNP
jgi:hypothetical protein